jgi:hypothetical protein
MTMDVVVHPILSLKAARTFEWIVSDPENVSGTLLRRQFFESRVIRPERAPTPPRPGHMDKHATALAFGRFDYIDSGILCPESPRILAAPLRLR